MKKILLTGSTGFIGKSFYNEYCSKYNILTFSFRNDDFSKLNLNKIDTIFHLSALVHKSPEKDYAEYKQVNVEQTIRLAKKAKKSGVRHFIFVSSVAVYGVDSGIVHENSLCNPQTNYAKTKLEAEKELLKLQSDTFIVSIVRIPIVTGYKAPGNMISLIKLVKRVSFLPLNKIQNKRSMLFIGNFLYLINLVIEKQTEGILLFSDNETISTTRLIQVIAKALKKRVYLFYIPFFENIIRFFKPSIYNKLFLSLEINNTITMKKLLINKNFLPYTIEDGIKIMVRGK